jgi:ATP-dependent helicase HepA
MPQTQPVVGSFASLGKNVNFQPNCIDVDTGAAVSSAWVAALGVGKVSVVNGAWTELTFFITPPQPETKTFRVPTSLVSPFVLPPETGAYWFDTTTRSWQRGRIFGPPIDGAALKHSKRSGLHYELRLPNSRRPLVPESELEVRCRLRVPDPTELLAAQVCETPFFAEGRATLLRHLATQQEALGGVTALGASSVELYSHQVSVVRRVLADPIQKYILADEVGLGKTIEAALLARQHLLDEGDEARVLVLCPGHLCDQWKAEFEDKIGLRVGQDVHVDAVDGSWQDDAPTMLIIDEAHQVASWAYGPSQAQTRFATLTRMAHAARSVLLLSATPVLHNEGGFFAMLHLLDSASYPLAKLSAFRAQVASRTVVAEALGKLVEGTPAEFAQESFEKLDNLLAQDPPGLAKLLAAKQSLSLDRPVGNQPEIRDLRAYVAESYKLHRRILRTRRDDKALREVLPSRCGLKKLACEPDEGRKAGEEFLDDWRASLPYQPTAAEQAQMVEVFRAFVAAHLSHPRCLLARIKERAVALAQAQTAAIFQDEPVVLARWTDTLTAACAQGDVRTACLLGWLQRGDKEPRERAIVFVDDPTIARQVAEQLASSLRAGKGAQVGLCTRGEMKAQQEFLRGSLRVLICDRTVEEGLNLQSVGATLVFFDLPLEPMRIEQRIGRLDRLEGKKLGQMLTFEPQSADPSEGYEGAWLRLLEESMRVFHRSIAPLQYALAAEMDRIVDQMPTLGRESLKEAAKRLQDKRTGLDVELRRIRNQELMDSMEWDAEEATLFLEAIQQAEEQAEDAGFEPFDAWLVNRLQYKRRSIAPNDHLSHLVHVQQTLVPLQVSHDQFLGFIDQQATRAARALCIGPLATDRAEAAESGATLLRVGHPFVERLLEWVRLDERGAAWAVWRQTFKVELAVPELYFCFDLVIEADPASALGVAERFHGAPAAVQRRLHAAFSPERRVVWVDAQGNLVPDGPRKRALEQSYLSVDKGGSDTNLRLERWLLAEERLGLSSWAETCRAARDAAERQVRKDQGFLRRCADSEKAFQRQFAQTRVALESRLARLDGPSRQAEEKLLALEDSLAEAIVAGLRRPVVRVDAAGAVILAADRLEKSDGGLS